MSDYYDMVQQWYDGYLFGREKMYCPWDVLSFVSSLQEGSYSDAGTDHMDLELMHAIGDEESLRVIEREDFWKFIRELIREADQKLWAGENYDVWANH